MSLVRVPAKSEPVTSDVGEPGIPGLWPDADLPASGPAAGGHESGLWSGDNPFDDASAPLDAADRPRALDGAFEDRVDVSRSDEAKVAGAGHGVIDSGEGDALDRRAGGSLGPDPSEDDSSPLMWERPDGGGPEDIGGAPGGGSQSAPRLAAQPPDSDRDREQGPLQASSGVLQALSAMQSLSPVLKAVSTFPGFAAGPTQVQDSIRQMSVAASGLASFVGERADVLEVCTPWARSTVAAACAEIVANEWVRVALSDGDPPQVTAEQFEPAVRLALAMPCNVAFHADEGGGVRAEVCIALFKALSPFATRLVRLEGFVEKTAGSDGGPPECIFGRVTERIGQFIVGVAIERVEEILEDGYASTHVERHLLLLAMIAHVADLTLAAWDEYQEELEVALLRAARAEGSGNVFSRYGPIDGPSLDAVFDRADSAVDVLVGITRRAMDRISKHAQGPL